MIAYQAMKLIVYADESGTHDWTGQSKGSMVPVICGYIDKLENWAAFCLDWKTTLNKYKAPFFHFSETPKSLRAKPNNPYHGWDNETVDDFIHELALIASVSAIPIGGQCNARIFNEVVTGSHPFKRMFEEFFNDFIEAMKAQWPNHDEPIIFVFDDSNDPNWKAMLLEVFNAYREKDSRLSAIYFVSGKKYPYYPLQAADMLSYLTRQVAEKYFAEMEQAAPKLQSRRILDLIMKQEHEADRPYS